MQLIYDSGYYIYAIVRRSDGYVYNHISAAFEVWDDDNLFADEYDYSLTDHGGDQYTWTFPILTESDYMVVYYLRTGSGISPTNDDVLINSVNVSYSGSAIVDPEAPPSGAYISIETGDNLALNRLFTSAWDSASDANKTAAVKMGTDIIDTLNFIGDRTVSTQDLEFPRDEDTAIPIEIQRACFEIALALLDGADPEFDFASLKLVSQGISSARSTYNRDSDLPHIIAGVPSITAWRLLKPYLRDMQNIELCRID